MTSENDPFSEEESHIDASSYNNKKRKYPLLSIEIASDMPQDSPVMERVRQISMLSPNFSEDSRGALAVPARKDGDY